MRNSFFSRNSIPKERLSFHFIQKFASNIIFPLSKFSQNTRLYVYIRVCIETKNDPFLQNSKPNSYSKLERRATHAETATSQFTKRTFWHTNVAGVFVCAL